MYYLDLFKLYQTTTKPARIEVRQLLNRNEVMQLKLKYQHGQCFYCCTPIGMSDHLDHLIPVYYGGTNKLRNLVASCKPCNLTKSTGQIEITNPYTIADYLKLQKAYKRLHGKRYAHKDKRYQLYKVYRADLFKYA